MINNRIRMPRFIANKATDENLELSRRRFIIEGCLSNSIFVLTSGAFFAGYAEYLGANSQFNGMIAALPSLAAAVQLLSPVVFERLTSRKKLISLLCLLYRSILAFMIFIPLITQNTQVRLLLLGSMYFLAYLLSGFLSPGGSSWIISLVPERMRGRYFGLRDTCILATAAVMSLLMGRILDVFEYDGNKYGGFFVVYMVIAVLVIGNFLTLRRIREPAITPSKVSISLKDVFKLPLLDKKFRKIVLLFVTWNLCVQVGLPFFSVYLVTGLKLSYTYITAISIAVSVMSAASAKIWGRIADRFSWQFTTALSIGMLGFCHIMWMMVDKNSYIFLLPFAQVLGGISWAGINMSLFNIQFLYAPQEGRTVFIGFNAAVSGIVGFISAMVGATLVGKLENINISLGFVNIGNMQFIFGLSGLLLIVCSICFRFLFARINKV